MDFLRSAIMEVNIMQKLVSVAVGVMSAVAYVLVFLKYTDACWIVLRVVISTILGTFLGIALYIFTHCLILEFKEYKSSRKELINHDTKISVQEKSRKKAS